MKKNVVFSIFLLAALHVPIFSTPCPKETYLIHIKNRYGKRIVLEGPGVGFKGRNEYLFQGKDRRICLPKGKSSELIVYADNWSYKKTFNEENSKSKSFEITEKKLADDWKKVQ